MPPVDTPPTAVPAPTGMLALFGVLVVIAIMGRRT